MDHQPQQKVNFENVLCVHLYQIEEKNVYMQRQSILKEIDTLRNRENELRMRTESFER